MERIPVSFVIPVFKSEKTIEGVIESINDEKEFDWEVVLINDNSPDNVDLSIKRLIQTFPNRITYLKHHFNSGQHAAIINGFNYTKNRYVATIDDDGQNPPSEILNMLKFLISNDLDVVYGKIEDRKQSFFRRILSRSNILLSEYTIGNKLLIPFSNVRVMRSIISKTMGTTSSQYNYIEGLIFSLTTKIDYLTITQKHRIIGSSNYNFISLVKLLGRYPFPKHLVYHL